MAIQRRSFLGVDPGAPANEKTSSEAAPSLTPLCLLLSPSLLSFLFFNTCTLHQYYLHCLNALKVAAMYNRPFSIMASSLCPSHHLWTLFGSLRRPSSWKAFNFGASEGSGQTPRVHPYWRMCDMRQRQVTVVVRPRPLCDREWRSVLQVNLMGGRKCHWQIVNCA